MLPRSFVSAATVLATCVLAGGQVLPTADTPINASHLRAEAERGQIHDQIALARALRSGVGMKQDPVEAVYWFTKAANQGDPEAQTELGYLHAIGSGVPQDANQAFRWFQRAAVENYAPAQNDVATMLFIGAGTRQDKTAAIAWWRRAAKQGLADAEVNLAIFQSSVGDALDSEQNAKDMRFWLERAAKQKDARGEFWLGTLYENGRGVRKDFSAAARLYRRGAEHGYSRAENNLAALYQDGRGVPQSLGEAAKWYQRSAEHGNDKAIENLAFLFATSHEDETKPQEAYFWGVIALSRSSENAGKDVRQLVELLRSRIPEAQKRQIEARAQDWIQNHPLNPESFTGDGSAEIVNLFAKYAERAPTN